jgi:hypothetical protein
MATNKNVWRGLDPVTQLAVLVELVIAAAAVSGAVNTSLDTLTEAQAKALAASFGARLNRAANSDVA